MTIDVAGIGFLPLLSTDVVRGGIVHERDTPIATTGRRPAHQCDPLERGVVGIATDNVDSATALTAVRENTLVIMDAPAPRTGTTPLLLSVSRTLLIATPPRNARPSENPSSGVRESASLANRIRTPSPMIVDETPSEEVEELTIFNVTKKPGDYQVNVELPHLVTLSGGKALLTTMSIHSTVEADYYTEFLMENDLEDIPARREWETETGPLPLCSNPHRYAAPPSTLFEGHSDSHFTQKLLWLNSKSVNLQLLAHLGSARKSFLSGEGWKSRLSPGRSLRKLLHLNPSPSNESLNSIGLLPFTEEQWTWEEWCLNTFHFRNDVELLMYRRHISILEADVETRPMEWAKVRDSLRRIWVSGNSPYPSSPLAVKYL
ncbi:hypothetical protein QCA50_010696 [Cerrena zonata]|uniref:Uncharacterized protein n=1 Tax=Cerrena zonata TaxID=2478898 RepID=A0AAW0G2I5_9APHY